MYSLKDKVDSWFEEEKLYLDSSLTIDEVAKGVCSNRTYISELFRYYGEPFREYLNNLRMEYAISLMREHVESKREIEVADIAIKSGFKTERTMNRYLNAKFGMTASKIMKELKNHYLCQKFDKNGGRKDNFLNERGRKDYSAQ